MDEEVAGMAFADLISIQLYSLRLAGDLDQQLDIVAELGFRRVETIGGHLADAAQSRAKLDARGLAAETGHVGMADLRTRPDWVLEQARVLGLRHLFMPAVPPEERQQPAERWRAVGLELARQAERFAAAGLPLGYHNHDWEIRPFADGTTPLEHLFAAAGSAPLSWEADLAWLVRGGADPKAWLARYGDRLVATHVKDVAAKGGNLDEDGWADVGSGILDWRELWPEAVARGARWMVLEHDKPSDARRFARASRDYLQRTID
jgi:sugar phosphate isomerase/epimerase